MIGELHLIESDLDELESAIAELADEVLDYLEPHAAFEDWLTHRART